MSAYVFRCLRNISKSYSVYRAPFTSVFKRSDVAIKHITCRLENKYAVCTST